MSSTLLSIKEAAPLIKCSTVTLRRMIHRREIGFRKIGKRYFFDPLHLQNYLTSVEVLPKAGTANKNGGN